MGLHREFPKSPYSIPKPEQRWFPAAEDLRASAYEKLLPPLVANIREEVSQWRATGYAGASTTSVTLLKHWFGDDHLIEQADGTLAPFRYYFAQREAVETVIWLYDVRGARDKFDLIRFSSLGDLRPNAKGRSAQDKRTLQIELTNFSVYYTQSAQDAITASMKEGKSEVVCERGALVKIAKDKNGIVTRETLTRHWTDWVDYWAVDFDYESRREIIKVPVGSDFSSAPAGLPPPQPSPASGEGARVAPSRRAAQGARAAPSRRAAP